MTRPDLPPIRSIARKTTIFVLVFALMISAATYSVELGGPDVSPVGTAQAAEGDVLWDTGASDVQRDGIEVAPEKGFVFWGDDQNDQIRVLHASNGSVYETVGLSQDPNDFEYDADNEMLFVAQRQFENNPVKAYDVTDSGLSLNWSASTGEDMDSVDYGGDFVFAAGSNDGVYKLHKSNGSQADSWSSAGRVAVTENIVYVGGETSGTGYDYDGNQQWTVSFQSDGSIGNRQDGVAADKSENTIWTANGRLIEIDEEGNEVTNVSANGQNTVAVDTGRVLAANGTHAQVYDPSDMSTLAVWSLEHTDGASGHFEIDKNESGDVHAFQAYDDGGSSVDYRVLKYDTALSGSLGGGGGNTVSGTVENQHGDSVSGATVEIVGVDFDQITPKSGLSNKDRAKELLDEASDPLPDEYDPNEKFVGDNGVFETASVEYAALHARSAWGLERWTTGADLDPPIGPTVPADQPIVVTVWEPEFATLKQAGIDDQLPGVTVKRPVIVERLDPFGDVVEKKTVELDEVRRRAGLASKDHAYATLVLQPGVYRIYPKGSTVKPVYLAGTESQVSDLFSTKLENEAGALSDAAQDIQDKVDSNKFNRTTLTTNASGQFSVDLPSGVSRVGIQAYKIDGKILKTISEPSIHDLKTEVETRGYNGSIYLSESPTMTDVPKSDVTVEVRKYSSPPFVSFDRYDEIFDELREILEEGTVANATMIYRDVNDKLDKSELQTRVEELTKLVKQALDAHPEWRDQWRDERDESIDDAIDEIENGERTQSELIEDLQLMSRLLDGLTQNLDDGESTSSVTENATISLRQAFDGDFDRSMVTVTVLWADGSAEPMPSEYWHVNKRVGRGDEVVVENFPLDDKELATIDIRVVDEDSRMGRSRETFANPNFNVEKPEIRSIDVTSIRPGVGEPVKVTPRIETAGWSVSGLTFYNPDGTEIKSSSNASASFTPSTKGAHYVVVNITDGDNSITETVKLVAGDDLLDAPPSVQVVEGSTGVFVLAGDQTRDAKVSVSDAGDVSVTVLVDEGSSPNEVHVYTESAPSSTRQNYKVRVIEGSDVSTGTAVDRHTGVYLHTDEIRENAVVYREGDDRQPILEDEDTRGGVRRTQTDGTVIETYTSKSGTVTVYVSSDPTLRERIGWGFRKRLATTDLPFIGMIAPIDVEPFQIITDISDDVSGVVMGVGA